MRVIANWIIAGAGILMTSMMIWSRRLGGRSTNRALLAICPYCGTGNRFDIDIEIETKLESGLESGLLNVRCVRCSKEFEIEVSHGQASVTR